MRGREGVVAVVDGNADAVFVWWANVGEKPQPSMSRLCGAWTLDPTDSATLESLTFRRLVLATKAGDKALRRAKVVPERRIDVQATLEAAVASRDTCQAAFEAEQSHRVPSKRLRPPTWPSFPDPLDVEKPPAWDVNDPSDDRLDPALAIAHWLAGMCSRWEDLESERLARPWMAAIDGDEERELPVVLIPSS